MKKYSIVYLQILSDIKLHKLCIIPGPLLASSMTLFLFYILYYYYYYKDKVEETYMQPSPRLDHIFI